MGYTWYGKTAQNEFSYDKRWVINNKNEKNNPSYMRISFYYTKNIVNMQFLIISKFLGPMKARPISKRRIKSKKK